MKYIMLFFILLCAGCDERPGRVYLGELIKVQAIANASKMLIETDKGFFVVRGYHSYGKGEKVWLNESEIYK